jgi:hypothetical protein
VVVKAKRLIITGSVEFKIATRFTRKLPENNGVALGSGGGGQQFPVTEAAVGRVWRK